MGSLIDSLIEVTLDVIFSPGLWLGVIAALGAGVIFHIAAGGGWRLLWRDLLAALVGFAVGQIIGLLTGNTWLRVGQVHLLYGAAFAIIAAFAHRVLLVGPPKRRR